MDEAEQETNAINEDKNKSTNAFIEGCMGCGCFLIIAFIIFSAVSWAWGIHWAFGLLLLLFVLGIR